MFFILSKVGFFFIQPSNALIFCALLGCLMMLTRWRRSGVWVTFSCVALVAACGLSPAANWLILPLEERFSEVKLPDRIDGVIVLGGAFDTTVMSARADPALNTAAERLTIVPGLAKRYPGVPIIHTGGDGHLVASGANEAEGAEALFDDFGLEKGRIVLESRSRNTVENAEFTRDLVSPEKGQTWLLVTSAFHMPRSVGVFRKAGWSGIIPYPVDFRTRGWQDLTRGFSGVSTGLRRFDIASREWIGLFVYWLTGRTGDLFPGPLSS